MKKYDYLIVGSGIFGLTCARLLTDSGKRCLVIDKRDHIGGNCYTQNVKGIEVHKYGPHIFHTNFDSVWDFVNSHTEVKPFVFRPKVIFGTKTYSFPINLMTLYQLFGTSTPQEAKQKIEEETSKYKELYKEPKNFYEAALCSVGLTIYNIFFKGYTTKQWNEDPKKISSDIFKRMMIRFNFDDNYFSDKWQGMPCYTKLFQSLSSGIEVRLNTNFLEDRDYFSHIANDIIYTGPIDEYFDWSEGVLDYRSLRFEEEILEEEDHQGTAVINYTSSVPWTRVIEHKHFTGIESPYTVVTKEFPQNWTKEKERFYPVMNERNSDLYKKYLKLSEGKNIHFGGRMGTYKYMNMDQTIYAAFKLTQKLLTND